MEGSLYELLCAKILTEAGWEVEWLGQQKGAYVDLLATRGDVVCALECKRHEAKVGVSAVRQVHASRCLNPTITHTAVIASSEFTPHAELMARGSGTLLLAHTDLAELFDRLVPGTQSTSSAPELLAHAPEYLRLALGTVPLFTGYTTTDLCKRTRTMLEQANASVDEGATDPVKRLVSSYLQATSTEDVFADVSGKLELLELLSARRYSSEERIQSASEHILSNMLAREISEASLGDALLRQAAIVMLFTATRQERDALKASTLRLRATLLDQANELLARARRVRIPAVALTYALAWSRVRSNNSKYVEHVPRVLSAMVMAAQRDELNKGLADAEFWDTQAAARVTRLAGFDPENWRHTRMVRRVRSLLQGNSPHTDALDVEPFLCAAPLDIELAPEDRDGFSRRARFLAFRICDRYLDAQAGEEAGLAPQMWVDARAFDLDRTNSLPFNMYLAIMRRCREPCQQDRTIARVNIREICEETRLDVRYPHNSAFYDRFISALDRMVDCGVIARWECAALLARPKHRVRVLNAELEVVQGMPVSSALDGESTKQKSSAPRSA